MNASSAVTNPPASTYSDASPAASVSFIAASDESARWKNTLTFCWPTPSIVILIETGRTAASGASIGSGGASGRRWIRPSSLHAVATTTRNRTPRISPIVHRSYDVRVRQRAVGSMQVTAVGCGDVSFAIAAARGVDAGEVEHALH